MFAQICVTATPGFLVPLELVIFINRLLALQTYLLSSIYVRVTLFFTPKINYSNWIRRFPRWRHSVASIGKKFYPTRSLTWHCKLVKVNVTHHCQMHQLTIISHLNASLKSCWHQWRLLVMHCWFIDGRTFKSLTTTTLLLSLICVLQKAGWSVFFVSACVCVCARVCARACLQMYLWSLGLVFPCFETCSVQSSVWLQSHATFDTIKAHTHTYTHTNTHTYTG